MAFKTFTASTALPAADLNTYLMKQAVIVCTSGTRPGSPVQGMTIYQTDTDSFRYYSGSIWDVFPGSLVATSTGANTVTSASSAEVIASSATAGLGLASLSLSSTRPYRVEIRGLSTNATSAAVNNVRVRAATGTVTISSTLICEGNPSTAGAGTGNGFGATFAAPWTPASTGTWNLAVSTTGGVSSNNGAWGPTSDANPIISLYGI